MEMTLIRGRILTFLDCPKPNDETPSFEYLEDGALIIQDGKIIFRGAFETALSTYETAPIIDHRPHLLLPGFIDTHTHYTQAQMIGAFGDSLLAWLSNYTFIEEQRFETLEHAHYVASHFLDELIRHGTTTAAVYGSIHEHSATAFFEEAQKRNMRMIAGNVLMDRNAPDALCLSPDKSYQLSKNLIDKWHGIGRLSYAITPRFAITSTEALLDITGTLKTEHADCYVQTHLSENKDELKATQKLFPKARDYLDVYEHYGLLGERSLFGHCLHLTNREIEALSQSKSVVVFCPTSNLFLGSGLFNFSKLDEAGIRLSIATDIGAGTDYSMLTTLSEAYKICQLQNYSLDPFLAFYLITLGNARALSLQDKIGTLEVGSEADIVVLNAHATPAMALRMEHVDCLKEELFILQTMGDDRVIETVYIAGEANKPA